MKVEGSYMVVLRKEVFKTSNRLEYSIWFRSACNLQHIHSPRIVLFPIALDIFTLWNIIILWQGSGFVERNPLRFSISFIFISCLLEQDLAGQVLVFRTFCVWMSEIIYLSRHTLKSLKACDNDLGTVALFYREWSVSPRVHWAGNCVDFQSEKWIYIHQNYIPRSSRRYPFKHFRNLLLFCTDFYWHLEKENPLSRKLSVPITCFLEIPINSNIIADGRSPQEVRPHFPWRSSTRPPAYPTIRLPHLVSKAYESHHGNLLLNSGSWLEL